MLRNGDHFITLENRSLTMKAIFIFVLYSLRFLLIDMMHNSFV
jgi:hypothetical protein